MVSLKKELQLWADRLIYLGIEDLLEEVLKKIKSLGGELDSFPAFRFDFYIFKSMLVNSPKDSDNYLLDLKNAFEKLETDWGEISRKGGIECYQWFCIRRIIIRRMAVEILKKSLEIDNVNSFVLKSPEKLTFSDKFNYPKYKNAISKLFNGYKNELLSNPIYSQSSFVTEEFALDEVRFTSDLVTPSNTGGRLSAAKILTLFRDNNQNHFIQDVSDFCDDVVRRVLPVPLFTYEYVVMDEVDRKKVTQSRSNSSNEDWTEEQKRTDGPYKDIISAFSASKGEVRATNYSSPIAKADVDDSSRYLVADHSAAGDEESDSSGQTKRRKSKTNMTLFDDQKSLDAVHDAKKNEDRPLRGIENECDGEVSKGNEGTQNLSILENQDPEETNTQPQSSDIEMPISTRKKRRSSLISDGVNAHKVTTIDEDEQQEAAPEKSAADSEDERQAKIAKVIDLNQKSFAPPATADAAKVATTLPPVDHAPKPKRRKWTADEEIAMIEALGKYYKGQWAQMKNDPEFAERLKGRSTVNMKDKYRDLLKHGKIQNVVEDEE